MFIYALKFFRGFLIGFLVFAFFNSFQEIDSFYDPGKISFYADQRVEFLAYVSDLIDQRIDHVKLTVVATSVNNKEVKGKVLVSTSFYPSYSYGDELLINCQLKKPKNFEDFSYDRYLAKSGIHVICSYPKIKLLSRGNGDFLLTKTFKIQKKLQEVINKNLPEPQASMLSAVVLGQRRGIPQNILDQFNVTGTTHLLAISGLHITIIFTVLMQILSSFYFSRKYSFYIVSVFLVFYLVLIGSPSSAVRAGIMGWLLILAMYLGRLNKSTNSILLAASIMVLINPRILRDDISFQLSFVATLGIIYYSPILKEYLKRVSNFLGLRDILTMSLAAYLATLPLVIFYFSRVSLVSLFANLFVVPVIAYMIIFGFLSILLSLIFPVLSFYVFLPSFFLLTYVLKIIYFFSLVPYASVNI